MIKKLLVIGIIFLFIGVTIVPAKAANKNKITNNYNQDISSTTDLFDRYIELLMKIGHMPSLSFGVIKDDELVFVKAYGYCDIENNKTTTLDTIYHIGSITKTITATAMMQIIENESYNVELDDDVNKYLPFTLRNPNFPNVNITIKMLLTHTSSIMDSGHVCHILPGDPNITTYPDPYLRDILLPNGSLYNPNIWSDKKPPGEIQHYTYSPWGLIEMIIGNITGKTINDYCKEHIFYPLEMYDTSYRLYDLDIDRCAVSYEYLKGSYLRLLHYSWIPYGVGNIRTTITDLSHFLIAHMNGGVWNGVRILNESTVEQMHTIQYPELGGSFREFGLGFSTWYHDKPFVKDMIGHSGFPYNRMFYRPSDNTGVIIFENSAGFPTTAADIGLRHYINDFIMSNVIKMILHTLFFRDKFSF